MLHMRLSKFIESVLEGQVSNKMLDKTRNTFCETWYVPHNQVHNDQTDVPIIMAGCIAHARNDHISTCAFKCDVTIVFLHPNFL